MSSFDEMGWEVYKASIPSILIIIVSLALLFILPILWYNRELFFKRSSMLEKINIITQEINYGSRIN